MMIRAKARILEQLGEQLIKNDGIALLELIKNSYDADATICTVSIQSPEEQDRAIISICDNGFGMTRSTLESAWLEIGTDWKASKKSKRDRSRFGRMPLGEKGIGRFGVHRLGKIVDLYTKAEGDEEQHLHIDWNQIDDSKFVEDIQIQIQRSSDSKIDGPTGTLIVISDLRAPWNKKMARECARAITSLNSPFDTPDAFKVKITIPNKDWLDSLPTFAQIFDCKLYSFDVLIEGARIVDFNYEFTPWPEMRHLDSRIVRFDASDIRSKIVRGKSSEEILNVSDYGFNKFRFRGAIFDNDAKIFKMALREPSVLKSYLKENGGIQVFRDGMRIMDYGDPGNDWLDLDGRRVNVPTKRFSNNLVVGGVFLDSRDLVSLQDIEVDRNRALVEKANREGFVENEAFDALRDSVLFAISRIEAERNHDKARIRTFYGTKSKAEPVASALVDLRAEVEEKIKDPETRRDLLLRIANLTKDYELLTESFIKSAGAGLNLITIIHQMEKIVFELRSGIQKKASYEFFDGRVRALTDLIEGYSVLVRSSPRSIRSLVPIVERALRNAAFRFQTHGVEIIKSFPSTADDAVAWCAESHVINALMNLIDNSLWWMKYAESESPTIFFGIVRLTDDECGLVVSDNGPGFSRPTDEIVQPFVSDKPNGMGIGLHLTKQIMDYLNGDLRFPDPEEFEVPAKLRKGATVALIFRTAKP